MKPVAIVAAIAGLVLVVAAVLFMKDLTKGSEKLVRETDKPPVSTHAPGNETHKPVPPADFRKDLGDLQVDSTEDYKDESQALAAIAAELENQSQSPSLEVTWRRTQPGQPGYICSAIYFQSEMRFIYRKGPEPEFSRDNLNPEDFLKIAHAEGSISQRFDRVNQEPVKPQ